MNRTLVMNILTSVAIAWLVAGSSMAQTGPQIRKLENGSGTRILVQATSPDGEAILGFLSGTPGYPVFQRADDFSTPVATPFSYPSLVARGGDVLVELSGPTRWDPSNGAKTLPLPSGFDPDSSNRDRWALSRDGEITVGTIQGGVEDWCFDQRAQSEYRAVRWQGITGPELLQAPPRLDALAQAVIAQKFADSPRTWESIERGVDILGTRARAVSQDGRVVVGEVVEFHSGKGQTRNCSQDLRIICESDSDCTGGPSDYCLPAELCPTFTSGYPARWVDGGPAQALVDIPSDPDLARGVGGTATVTNSDGSAAAGRAQGFGAYRWTESGGAEPLTPIAGTGSATPTAMSWDGVRVVGELSLSDFSLKNRRCSRHSPAGCPSGKEAFIWDPEDGMRFLRDVLENDFGVDVTGWHLSGVDSLSETTDGQVLLIGPGYAPDASTADWWVEIPCSDPDADGLCSIWEDMGGIDLNGDLAIDPADDVVLAPNSLGAGPDPLHKDVYVEVDVLDSASWFGTNNIADLERAFAAAPANLVGNPDGLPGIHLHLEWTVPPGGLQHPGALCPAPFAAGQRCWNLSTDPCRLDPAFVSFKSTHFGDPGQSQAILDARRRFYRYAVVGGDLLVPGTGIVTGQAELGGNDLIISPESPVQIARSAFDFDLAEKIVDGTLMHELGHTLGLFHAGPGPGLDLAESENRKPNYHSVMNYLWQFPPLPVAPENTALASQLFRNSWTLDYSRESMTLLDERSDALCPPLLDCGLVEAAGLGGSAWWRAVPYGSFDPANPAPLPVAFEGRLPVDWNQNGLDGEVVRTDVQLNNQSGGQSGVFTSLVPYEDWSFVAGNLAESLGNPAWTDQAVASCTVFGAGLSAPLTEPTLDEFETLAAEVGFVDCNGNGVDDATDFTSGVDVDANGDGILDGCEPLRGDCDDDGDVDEGDYDVLLASFGRSLGEPEYVGLADLDRDSLVSFVDVQLWNEAYAAFQAASVPISTGAGASAPASAGPACGLLGPEALVAFFAARALLRRRRRTGREAAALRR